MEKNQQVKKAPKVRHVVCATFSYKGSSLREQQCLIMNKSSLKVTSILDKEVSSNTGMCALSRAL